MSTQEVKFADGSVDSLACDLKRWADSLLAERIKRYSTELQRLLLRARNNAYADEIVALESELGLLASGESSGALARTNGSPDLHRARRRFMRDMEVIRWHVPEYRPVYTGERSSLLETLRNAFERLCSGRVKTLAAEGASA